MDATSLLAVQVLVPFLVAFFLVWAGSVATGREINRGLVLLVAVVILAVLRWRG